jgi:hypothetical protein
MRRLNKRRLIKQHGRIEAKSVKIFKEKLRSIENHEIPAKIYDYFRYYLETETIYTKENIT